MSDGPNDSVVEPEAEAPTDENLTLEGFSEAMLGNAAIEEHGEPERADAAGNSEVEETSAEEAPEEPVEETENSTPEADADESDPKPEVSFDGFSDEQKTTWERLYEGGHATAEEVERARTESMFQSNYTKKTMTLAEQRKALEKDAEVNKEDLELLKRLREDDRLYSAWQRLTQGDIGLESEGDDYDADEFVSRKDMEKVVEERIAAREAERAARTAKEQQRYEAKKSAMSESIKELMDDLGVDGPTMQGYLTAEESELPADQDPILALDPVELRRSLMRRHELESLRAEAKALKNKLSQTESKRARSAKQSSPPNSRVATRKSENPMRQAEAELGVAPDWSNVAGFGHRQR